MVGSQSGTHLCAIESLSQKEPEVKQKIYTKLEYTMLSAECPPKVYCD